MARPKFWTADRINLLKTTSSEVNNIEELKQKLDSIDPKFKFLSTDKLYRRLCLYDIYLPDEITSKNKYKYKNRNDNMLVVYKNTLFISTNMLAAITGISAKNIFNTFKEMTKYTLFPVIAGTFFPLNEIAPLLYRYITINVLNRKYLRSVAQFIYSQVRRKQFNFDIKTLTTCFEKKILYVEEQRLESENIVQTNNQVLTKKIIPDVIPTRKYEQLSFIKKYIFEQKATSSEDIIKDLTVFCNSDELLRACIDLLKE